MRRRDLASAALGAGALAAAVFAIGGAERWGQALVAALAALALVPLIASRRHLARASPLIAVLGVAAALTALQLVPLPAALAALLSPTGAALRAEGSALAGVAPWPGLSLDAPGTLRALAAQLALLAIAGLALRLAVSEQGRYRVLATVALLCGGVAGVVGVHALVDARRLYGVYELTHAGPHLLGPLLNLNHLGGLLALGAVVAIGLTAYRRQAAWRRVGWLVLACACGAVAVATISRGATLALAAGALVTVGTLLAQRLTGDPAPGRRRSTLLTHSLPLGIVAACVVILVIHTAAGRVVSQLEHTSLDEMAAPTSKYAAWRSTLVLIEEAPWTGVGRGAFETSFTRVHPAAGTITFSHVENALLQAVVDWGIPGALVLAAALAWLLAVVVRRWRDGALAAAALGGLTVIAVQSNVDFGLELLGIAAPVVALIATLAYVPLRDAPPALRGRLRALRVAHVLALLVGAALLLAPWARSVDEDHARIRAAATAGPRELAAELDGALTRHPLDYYAFAVAAELAMRREEPAAVGLLNHALRLSPTHAGLHRLAARMLYRNGHLEQAVVEYAAAMRAQGLTKPLLAEVVARLPAHLAARVLPTQGVRLEAALDALRALGRPAVATAYLERILTLTPGHPRACELLTAQLARAPAPAADLAARRCPPAPPR